MADHAQTRPASDSPPRPLRILIVKVGAMGDVLHAIPAVAALRVQLPDCFLGWAIDPRWSPLLATGNASPHTPSMPLVDRLHLVPTRSWKRRPMSLATLREILLLRRELRAQHYDLCIDLQGSIRSAVIARLPNAARVLGSRSPREAQARFLYHQRVATLSEHVIDQSCELIQAALQLKAQAASTALAPCPAILPTNPEAEQWCASLLQSLRMHPDQPFVLLAPTAGWGAKEWPLKSFATLAEALAARGFLVLVNAAPTAEQPASAALFKDSGATPIPCTLTQLIALTRRAALVIGGDTGPLHLAAALGRPVVALFGPTDPARNGPHFPGACNEVLRHTSSVLNYKRLHQTEAGLATISVADVLSAALRLLAPSALPVRRHG